MKMSKRAEKALRGSIKKWEAIVSGEGCDDADANCPLCLLYHNNDCVKCPVFVVVGEDEGLIKSHPQTLLLLEKYNVLYESKTYPGYDHHNMKFHHPLGDAIAFFQKNMK